MVFGACKGEDRPKGLPGLPTLEVIRAAQQPTLDGLLQERDWHRAKSTGPFLEPRRGGRATVEASAKALWDERYLYVAVEVVDTHLLASDLERDAHLWEQDCVELMVDPKGIGRAYFEIEVSPRGTVFDSRFDSRRTPAPFGHVGWDSGVRVGVHRSGTLDDEQVDSGYTVEMAIPWQAFSPESARGPEVGETWRANFYVLDLGPTARRAAAWSSLGVSDFHSPLRFGRLTFTGP